MKRIKLAYEHLVQKNEVYRQRAVRKCRCGYLAMSLCDLERHQQCGYTKATGSVAFSYNRYIWCCICNNRYNVSQFSRHMLKEHNLTTRIPLPVVNQCPFCSYSGHDNVKTVDHILKCQKLFRPSYNLYHTRSAYDLPLHYIGSQPWHNSSLPQKALPTGSCLPTGHHSVVPPPPVPISFFTGAMAHGVAVTASAVTNLQSYPGSLGSHASDIANGILAASHISASARLPAVPVGIYGSGLGLQSLMSVPSPSLFAFRMSKPNIFGNRSAVNFAQLNYYRSVQPGNMPMQPAFVNSTGLVRNNMPYTTGCGFVTPLSSLQNFTSAPSQTISNPRKVPEKLWAKTTSKSGSRCALPKKHIVSISSARSPVVVLRRLTVSVCEVCGSVFEKPELLCSHLQNAHSIVVTEKDLAEGSPRKSLPCLCCRLKFFSKQGLDRHLHIVHGIVSGLYTCPRCSEKGICDLFEHFRVKHNISVLMMILWRVCFICKLNFATVADVERHVQSVHRDVFPSRLHFRDAVQAAKANRNRTASQTQRNLPESGGNNSVVRSDLQQPAVNMKSNHSSVIEIAEDTSNLDSGDSVNIQVVAEKRKRQTDIVIDLTSSETDSTLHSSGNEPATKKVRRNSNVSEGDLYCHTPDVPMALSPQNTSHEQHSVRALPRGVVLGTVSLLAKNHPVLLKSLTEERKSDSNSVDMPEVASDVPVRFIPLCSVRDEDSSGESDVSVRIQPLDYRGIEDLSVEKDKVQPENSMDTAVAKESTKSSRISTGKHTGISDVSVRIEPLNSFQVEKSSVCKLRSTQKADSAVMPSSKKSSTSQPTGVSDVSIRTEPLITLHTDELLVKKDKSRSVHNARASIVPLFNKSMQCSDIGTNYPVGISDISVRIKPLNSLCIEGSSAEKDKGPFMHDKGLPIVPPSKTTSKPTSISDVSVRIKPVHSPVCEVPLIKEDKGQYRYVHLFCWQQRANFLLTTFVVQEEQLVIFVCLYTPLLQ